MGRSASRRHASTAANLGGRKMHIKIKDQLVELLEEEPEAEAGNGFMFACGILLLGFAVAAAFMAVIF